MLQLVLRRQQHWQGLQLHAGHLAEEDPVPDQPRGPRVALVHHPAAPHDHHRTLSLEIFTAHIRRRHQVGNRLL